MRDALSLLEQARAYCGDNIPDKEVRELLGVVPEDALNELVEAIATGSADRALGLVHTFQKEGRNLQHFCREAIRHMRNLLIARVCGADSDLIAATPDQRPPLAKAAAQFSEEDLTRFFNILLQTDDDLRRKPDPRVHLEMGLLRLIHAGRLAPLEELLADLGDATGNGGAAKSSTARASALPAATPAWSGKNEIANAATAGVGASLATAPNNSAAAPLTFSSPAWSKRPETFANRSEVATSVARPAPLTGTATEGETLSQKSRPNAAMIDSVATGKPIIADEKAAQREAAFEIPDAKSQSAANIAESQPQSIINRVEANGLADAQVAEIRSAIQAQQKFLGELLEHAHRWELEGAELRIFFATEKRAFAEMVEGRDSLEKIRAASGKVLNRSVRVCAKMESVAAAAASASQAASGTKELREKFERDPMVRSMLQRFGGRISEVKRREEVS
jgi:DNA polymerase-3 subunit gamma/tau